MDVWYGHLVDDDRPVAVKRASDPDDPATGIRLRSEAAVAGAVDHPGLLVPLRVVDDPPGVAIVYPYLCGGSLRGLLDRRGALTPGELVAVLDPVAAALRARSLDGQHPAHGDLKPDNLLLRDDGSPVVADAGSIGWATPDYLDPAASVGAPPSPQRDVFALGVMAYEALTGRRPHRGGPAEVVALAAAGAHRRLDGWPGVPAGVAAVVESALDPDPMARPATPVAFVTALRATVDPATVVLPGPAPHAAPPTVRPGQATLELDPRPPAPDAVPGDRPIDRRWVAGAVAAGVLVVGASVLAPTAPTARTPPASSTGSTASPGAVTSDGSTGCAAVERSDGIVAVDLDGDGCDDPARWDGEVLAAGHGPSTGASNGVPERVRVGGGRLQVRFGDWDGDGATTVAAYDPDTGVVRYLDRLDRPEQERVATARLDGRARVIRSERGDRVVVDPG